VARAFPLIKLLGGLKWKNKQLLAKAIKLNIKDIGTLQGL